MVDGVNGYLDHAVRHVVVEYRILLESVIIPNLFVVEKNVWAKAIQFTQENAMIFAVLVSFFMYLRIAIYVTNLSSIAIQV